MGQQAAAHTPGPWAWDDDLRALRPANPDPDRSAVHTILVNDGTFGFLGSDHKATEAEYQACCRLIAAAPDMLAALRVAEDSVGDMNALKVVRAAIAKATGAAQ